MDTVLSSRSKKALLHVVTGLFVMVITTNAKIKGYFECTATPRKAITCLNTNLPTITNGSFVCNSSSGVLSEGEACTLTCKRGFYPAFSEQTVCEQEAHDHTGKWSNGSFMCLAITCSTTNLPTVKNGSFDCVPNSDVLTEGEGCTLRCHNDFYSAYFSLNQTVCVQEVTNKRGQWSDGSFVCHGCQEWHEWNGREYKLTSTLTTWEESWKLCNSHLVTIENEEENEFVRKMLQHCSYDKPWIGLNDRDMEGAWVWNNGTMSTYRNWQENKPNGGETQDCVGIYSRDGKWYDFNCDGDRRAVCERNYHRK